MKRRELLRLLSIAGSTLVLDLDWERIGNALAQPAQVDAPVLQYLETLNHLYWQNYRAATQKSVILDDVLAHLGALTQALHAAQTTTQRQHLSVLTSPRIAQRG